MTHNWSIYVPPYKERLVLIVGIFINWIVMASMCYIEQDIYKFLSLVPLGVFGLLYWSEDTPSTYRDTIKIVDQCSILFAVGFHMLYFKYYIQYILILLSIVFFLLENLYEHIWFIFHIYIYLCLLISFMSTYYKIVIISV